MIRTQPPPPPDVHLLRAFRSASLLSAGVPEITVCQGKRLLDGKVDPFLGQDRDEVALGQQVASLFNFCPATLSGEAGDEHEDDQGADDDQHRESKMPRHGVNPIGRGGWPVLHVGFRSRAPAWIRSRYCRYPKRVWDCLDAGSYGARLDYSGPAPLLCKARLCAGMCNCPG